MHVLWRFGYLQRKIGVAPWPPCIRDMAARDAVRACAIQRAGHDDGLAVVQLRVVQIDQDVRLLAGRKGVAMHAHALGRGQFRADLGRVQRDGVVAGRHDLGRVAKTRAVASLRVLARARLQLGLTHAGCHQKVEQVCRAGAAQVRVAEAHDRRVCVVVAGTPIPALVIGIGAKLHRAKRQAGTRIGMAMATRANMRIHPLQHVVVFDCWRFGKQRRAAQGGVRNSGNGGGGFEELTARNHGCLRRIHGTASTRASAATKPCLPIKVLRKDVHDEEQPTVSARGHLDRTC